MSIPQATKKHAGQPRKLWVGNEVVAYPGAYGGEPPRPGPCEGGAKRLSPPLPPGLERPVTPGAAAYGGPQGLPRAPARAAPPGPRSPISCQPWPVSTRGVHRQRRGAPRAARPASPLGHCRRPHGSGHALRGGREGESRAPLSATGPCLGQQRHRCGRLHEPLVRARRPRVGARLAALDSWHPSLALFREGLC